MGGGNRRAAALARFARRLEDGYRAMG